MGYGFQVADYYTVKDTGWYPWPWPGDPARTIKLYAGNGGDILTKDPKEGTYTKQTGMGCFGIVLKDDEVIFHKGEVANLHML